MLFENEELIEKVVLELGLTLRLNELARKSHRCFLNYLRLVDKCYTLESSRVSNGVRGAYHHILPRSLFPEYEKAIPPLRSNWNEVLMTHKEHFVAHHLLFEIYGRSGPMAKAFLRVCNGTSTSEFCKKMNLDQLRNWNYQVSESTRSKLSACKKGKAQTEEHKKKVRETLVGRPVSQSTRDKMSKSKSGENHHFYGKTLTESHLKKMSDSMRGLKKNLKVVECPHCGMVGSGPNMTRYHFNKCNSIIKV